ncbi:MAG TPA: lactate permease LctP family transporter [Bryobacteraceae bacterium]|nr:lactate permease LctP family transporter [Bryobacteraceae bacterium]
MWEQNYSPVAHSLAWSTLVASIPVVALLYAIGIRRVSAWKSSLLGLVVAWLVAVLAYRMPAGLAVDSALYGAAFGAFPIFWVVYWAIALYRLTVETGKFEILKNSIGHLTSDKSLQALLIAFAFGAFLEGAAGFGTPVAVAAAILAGLGFSAFYGAGICLLANTAPVAFGSLAIPLVTLAATTSIPIDQLSKHVGRLCAPVSFFIPGYLIVVMGGFRALRRVWPAALVCGASFAGVQFTVSNFVGPYLTDILGSLAAVVAIVVLLRFWAPEGNVRTRATQYSFLELIAAWGPYLLLVIFILAWSVGSIKSVLAQASLTIAWPGLHNIIQQIPPVVPKPAPYAAIYRFRYLAEAGTACAFATFASALLLRVRPRVFLRLLWESAVQLRFSFVSIVAVLALAFVMNYSGATATLGLAFATTGHAFPYFSAMLGWLGVFLTGSDTSSNALFGSLQQVTARRLGLNPALMASANSAGGVMGKMISLQSISVAAAAAGLEAKDEPALFRFTLKHSLLLASVIGVLALVYAYGG